MAEEAEETTEETHEASEAEAQPADGQASARPGRMDRAEQRRVVEALVLASPEPLSASRIAEILPYGKPGKVKDLVGELNEEYQQQDRAFEIWEVAGGYQIRTRAEFSGYLQKLQKLRPLRLSQAALETLSIVAYRQPVTRAEIEQVRGVDAGPVVKSLLERQLIKIVGQREVPGRPMVYGTTRRFLEVFGLPTLKELPPLRELEELTRDLEAASEESAPAEGSGDADGAEELADPGEAAEAVAEAASAVSADDELEDDDGGRSEAEGDAVPQDDEVGGDEVVDEAEGEEVLD